MLTTAETLSVDDTLNHVINMQSAGQTAHRAVERLLGDRPALATSKHYQICWQSLSAPVRTFLLPQNVCQPFRRPDTDAMTLHVQNGDVDSLSGEPGGEPHENIRRYLTAAAET